jgi:chromosome segregation ATPase
MEQESTQLYVLMEHKLMPEGQTLVNAIYDNAEQALRRGRQIAERRRGELAAAAVVAATGEADTPLRTVTYIAEEDAAAPSGTLLGVNLFCDTTEITPAGYLFAESRVTKRETVGRFELMAGCDRYRLRELEQGKQALAALTEQLECAERTAAQQLETHCAQIENLRTRLEATQRAYRVSIEDGQRLRRLADEYQRDYLDTKLALQTVREQSADNEKKIAAVRSMSKIYAAEIERLHDEAKQQQQRGEQQRAETADALRHYVEREEQLADELARALDQTELLERNVEELSQKDAELSECVANFRSNAQKSFAKTTELQSEIVRLKSREEQLRTTHDEICEQFYGESCELRGEISRLRETIKQQSAKTEKLEADYNQVIEEISQFYCENTELRSQAARLREAAKQQQLVDEQLQRDHDEVVDQFTAEKQELTERLARCEAALEQLQERESQQQYDHDEIVEQFTAENHELAEQLEEYEDAQEAVDSELEELRAENARLVERLNECASWQESETELREQLEQATADNDDLTCKLQKYKARLSKLSKRYEAAETKLHDAEHRLIELEAPAAPAKLVRRARSDLTDSDESFSKMLDELKLVLNRNGGVKQY